MRFIQYLIELVNLNILIEFFKSIYYRYCYTINLKSNNRYVFLKKKYLFIKTLEIVFLSWFIILSSKHNSKNNIILINDNVPRLQKFIDLQFLTANTNFRFILSSEFKNSLFLRKKKNFMRKIHDILLNYILGRKSFNNIILDCDGILLFEGDRVDDMIMGFILKNIGKKVILIQRSGYINNNLSGAQVNYQITDFLSLSKFDIERLRKYSNKEINWYLINDPYLKIKNHSSKRRVFFVGQPFIESPNNELALKIQTLKVEEYQKKILNILRFFKSKGYKVIYLTHPLELNPNYLDKDISIKYIDQIYFNRNDIAIGYYSSLLCQLYFCKIQIILLGKNYDNLIFKKYIDLGNPKMINIDISKYKSKEVSFYLDKLLMKINHINEITYKNHIPSNPNISNQIVDILNK